MTVTSEIPAAHVDTTDRTGPQWWPQEQSLHLDEIVWRHPSSRPLPPSIVVAGGGMALVTRDPPLRECVLEVGVSYLVGLASDRQGAWLDTTPALDVVDGRVDPSAAGVYPLFAREFAGLDAAAIGRKLAAAVPNAIAEAHRDVGPYDRVKMVLAGG